MIRRISHVVPSEAVRRARRGERGAALVELSFIAIILLVMVAGTFDYGFAYRTSLAANEAARAGARVGSGQATSAGADYYALNGVKSTLTASGVIDLTQKVIIYKATTSDGKVPTTCTQSSPSGTCNVLTGAQLKALTVNSFDVTISSNPFVKPTGTGCLKSTAATRVGWCPNVRSNVQESGADFYGVYVEIKYPHKFAPRGATTTVKRTAVMRLEPTEFGS